MAKSELESEMVAFWNNKIAPPSPVRIRVVEEEEGEDNELTSIAAAAAAAVKQLANAWNTLHACAVHLRCGTSRFFFPRLAALR